MPRSDPAESESLVEELERELHKLLASNPTLRDFAERNRIGATVDLRGGESTDPIVDIVGVLIEHAFRVSEEVDRLRGIANLDEEAGT